MSEALKFHHKTDKESFLEEKKSLNWFKTKNNEYTIYLNAQLCYSIALAGAEEHPEELKATRKKFKQFLCKASATAKQFKQKN